MARATAALPAEGHPAPHRDRAGLVELAFALLAPPAAWGLHLLVNYGIASHVCFPGPATRHAEPNVPGRLWLVVLSVDLISIAVTVAAWVISYAIWRSTREEHPGGPATLLEIGEGRTRFLALWGMIISAGFLLAVIFDLVTPVVLRQCG